MTGAPGIEQYHAADCPAKNGRRCKRVECSYRVKVYNRFTGKQESSPRLPTLEQAKEWQRNRKAELRERRTAGPTPTITLSEAWPLWLAKARAGGVLARGDKPYKPRPLDDYEQLIAKHVLPDYGGNQLAEITTDGLQRFVSDLMANGSSPSTVRNIVNPIRSLYRDAALIVPHWHGYNPTVRLKLPKVNSRRSEDRMPSPEQVAALVAAAPEKDRPIWATAALAGLRLGELQALRWRDVDLKADVIRVRRSYARKHGVGAAKSYAGERDIPIFALLRPHLDALKRGKPDEPVFPADGPRAEAFHPGKLIERADTAWTAAGVERFTPHECRHGAASVWIEAGVIPRRVQKWLGHADISTTFGIYGKLLDRSEPESVAKVDAYLAAVGTSMGTSDADQSGLERSAKAPQKAAA
jgi:integrase